MRIDNQSWPNVVCFRDSSLSSSEFDSDLNLNNEDAREGKTNSGGAKFPDKSGNPAFRNHLDC